MASDSFYNTGDEWMQNYEKDPYRFMKKRAMVRNVAPKLYSGAEKVYNRMPPGDQKQVQRKLQNLQKKNPGLAKALAAKKPSAIIGLAKNLRRQVDWGTDWLFILLFSFGLLKDIFDIAFAALGAVPSVGPAGTAIGIVVSFVGDLMFLILTMTVLILVGSSIKNRGPAKYFVSTAMEFIAEALPAISWLPWTPVYVTVLYLFVLYDRAYQDQGVQSAATNIPASGTAADSYSNRLAA
jgi:hypothetical protein